MTSLRAVRIRNPDRRSQKGYQRSWRFESSEGILWTVDMFGSLLSKPTEARGENGVSAWSVRRNRAVMPTAWLLADAEGHNVGALRANWMSRKAWRAQTDGGAEIFTLMDPRKGASYLLDLPSDPELPEWLVARSNRVIGGLRRVESVEAPRGRGPLKALANFVRERDWVMDISGPAGVPDLRLMALGILVVEEVTRPLDAGA